MKSNVETVELPRVSIMNLYTVRDELAEECGPIFMAVNDAVAKRNFMDMLVKMPTGMVKDFSLMRIATYDVISGNVAGIIPQVVKFNQEVVENEA